MPDCAEGKPMEGWYLLGFALSMVWVAVFSFIVSSTIMRWVRGLDGIMRFHIGVLWTSDLQLPFSLKSWLCPGIPHTYDIYITRSHHLQVIISPQVKLTELSMAFFGLLLVAMGAQIPDTIQSLSVAKKGYGSMAVANAFGRWFGIEFGAFVLFYGKTIEVKNVIPNEPTHIRYCLFSTSVVCRDEK